MSSIQYIPRFSQELFTNDFFIFINTSHLFIMCYLKYFHLAKKIQDQEFELIIFFEHIEIILNLQMHN